MFAVFLSTLQALVFGLEDYIHRLSAYLLPSGRTSIESTRAGLSLEGFDEIVPFMIAVINAILAKVEVFGCLLVLAAGETEKIFHTFIVTVLEGANFLFLLFCLLLYLVDLDQKVI